MELLPSLPDVVSSWAPQMADELHLSSTDINLVAAAGNFGVYLTGPLWGLYADKKGARELLYVGSILLGGGYGGLAWAFSNGAKLWVLVIFSFCTGLGSCAGNTAGLNTVARSFGAETRGLAFGIVVAAYGLSAFFYSSISGYIVGDDTRAFLLILAFGTFLSLCISGLLLHPDRVNDAYAPLPLTPTTPTLYRTRSSMSADEEADISHTTADESADLSYNPNVKNDIGGITLLKVPDYYILMVATFCLTGTGLMWINSIGTIVVTLARYNHTVGKITRLQSHQTSLLSIFNCMGRLFIGAASDRVRIKTGLRPIWWLLFICTTFLTSQVLAKGARDLTSLTWATSLVGFSYGQFYGLAPLVLLEWFGLTYFSSNVGMLYMVPTLSSYAFSHLFGQIYDSNIDVSSFAKRAGIPDGHTHTCPNGADCYTDVFRYTICACVLAGVLSVLLGIRRGRTSQSHETTDAHGSPGGRSVAAH